MNLFKHCLNKLAELQCVVTLEEGKYVVKEKMDLNKIVKEISCLDPQKDLKLLDCCHELRG